jgi:hypothetical protein
MSKVPKQETLEDKLQSLVDKWHQRQLHYQDVAEDNITHQHTNRKFTYKAMATRDCWKELLTLLNETKKEMSYANNEITLEDVFNDEKKKSLKKFIDKHKKK